MDGFAEAVGAVTWRADVHGESWLVEGKYYGGAIVSKYRLEEYGVFNLPNPMLEVIRPNGDRWTTHDKSVQSAVIRVGGSAIELFNIHYFPFHHFRRSLGEPEFQEDRRSFVEALTLRKDMPVVVAGDFNNNDAPLDSAFPELFEGGGFASAVQFDPDHLDGRYYGNHQMDYVLYTTADFDVVSARIVRDFSDHHGIIANLALRATEGA